MSYPDGLSEQQMKIMQEAMDFPLYRKGDIILHLGKHRLEILEDSTAHGCPLTRELKTGEVRYTTMYGHYDVYKQLCEKHSVNPEPRNSKRE